MIEISLYITGKSHCYSLGMVKIEASDDSHFMHQTVSSIPILVSVVFPSLHLACYWGEPHTRDTTDFRSLHLHIYVFMDTYVAAL